MNIDEYEVYARERRLKSKIACCFDKCMKEDVKKHGCLTQLINGGITSDSFGNPYMYECTIGDGYEEEGKRWTTSNMYHIYFYSGCRGCTIYKSLKRSIHEKCFVCGESLEPFGKNFFSAGCRVYEDLEKDEVIKMLVNKDWTTFYNVSNNKNKTNYMFLKEMKKRLIKTLEYNNVIYYSEKQKQYVDYNLFKMFPKSY